MNTEGSADDLDIATTVVESQKQRTPSPKPATADHSSPTLPPRIRKGSSARKRTNEEAYQPVDPPQTSPRTAKFPRSITFATMADVQQATSNNFATAGEQDQTQPTAVNSTQASEEAVPEKTFVSQIHDYQQDLELDYQKFEKAMDERDTTVSLEAMDWKELEASYNKEIQPLLAQEQDVMGEFNERFKQFLLYMEVSNKHEAERATKRLKTRIALAQHSEDKLAKKQDHHAKVLEAFQKAMALLNV